MRASFVGLVGVVFIAWILAQYAALAQGADDFDALERQVMQLYKQGKYSEATELAERALSLAERVFGPEHPSTLTSVNNLGFLYDALGRYDEAVHMIVPAGGISLDGERWIARKPNFFLPVFVLSKLFRRLMLEKLLAAHTAGKLKFFGDFGSLADRQAFVTFLAPLKSWSKHCAGRASPAAHQNHRLDRSAVPAGLKGVKHVRSRASVMYLRVGQLQRDCPPGQRHGHGLSL